MSNVVNEPLCFLRKVFIFCHITGRAFWYIIQLILSSSNGTCTYLRWHRVAVPFTLYNVYVSSEKHGVSVSCVNVLFANRLQTNFIWRYCTSVEWPPFRCIWMGVPEVSNSLVKNIDHWHYWPNVCIGNTIATCRIFFETIKGTYNQSILPFPFLNGW